MARGLWGMLFGGGCANGDLTSHPAAWESSHCTTQKSAYFPTLTLSPIQEPLNHKLPVLIAVQKPALPGGTSAMMDMSYICSVQCSGHQPHVTIQQLKCGQCDI